MLDQISPSELGMDDLDISEEDASLKRIKPWNQWSAEDKQIMEDHCEYFKKAIGQIEKAWAKGPMAARGHSLQKPASDLQSVIYKKLKNSSKGKGKKTKTPVREKAITVAKMTPDEFNVYLKTLLRTETISLINTEEMPTADLSDMAKYLSNHLKALDEGENKMLQSHIKFGDNLKTAQRVFRSQKHSAEGTSEKITWKKWIECNVKTSFSNAMKHIQVASLAGEYPRLKNLATTFKELLRMRKKIETVFNIHKNIAKEWTTLYFAN